MKFKISAFLTICLVLSLSLNYRYFADGYFSHGIYAVTDFMYDGFIFDAAIYGYLCASFGLISVDMYSVASVKECKHYCLQYDTCRSLVIDRVKHICYASSFDRCRKSNHDAFLRQSFDYVTYDIILGNSNGTNETCLQQCLNANENNCSLCGRTWCSGRFCNKCKKACWEIPQTNGSTTFWPDLFNNVFVGCTGPWQTAFSRSSDQTYPDMNREPLWLQVLVTLSNGSTYNSYFVSVILSGSQITVGNYLGGNAGNPWGAPQTLTMSHFPNTTTCNSFYYAEQPTCNISSNQIPTIATQAANGIIYFTRGYVWSICNQPSFPSNINVYVSNIELLVTPVNNSVANQLNWTVSNQC